MRVLSLLFAVVALFASGCDDRPAMRSMPIGGDFVLQSADGPVDTRALRGKVVLLYFGYTKCPDICPTSMSTNAQALATLSDEERRKTVVMLVSLDPDRDTLPILKQYASFFHPNMIGVTGNAAEIETIAKAYGVGYVKQKPDANGNYAVDHSAQTFVLGPDGKIGAILQLGATADQTAATIRSLL